MKASGNKKYLIAAILWTVWALLVLGFLLFAVKTTLLIQAAGTVLIVLCVFGQWMRYYKSR